jgi:hypothetical protein
VNFRPPSSGAAGHNAAGVRDAVRIAAFLERFMLRNIIFIIESHAAEDSRGTLKSAPSLPTNG